MPPIDLSFPLLSTHPIPADHGYLLYAALSQALPELHGGNGVAVHPIRGRQAGDRLLLLMPWSALRLRTAAERIPELLALSGKRLDLSGRILRLGAPRVYPLRPATALRSRLVTIKLSEVQGDAAALTPENFLAGLRRQLDSLGVSPQAEAGLGTRTNPDGDPAPIRRTLRIKNKEVVGYEVILQHLTAEESLLIQERGLGGRRHMGCGVFAPFE